MFFRDWDYPLYIDYSLASRYLAFDIRQRRWSEEILAATEINAECLPVPVPAGTIAGKLDAAAASQLGLSPGTIVVMGGHDQPCGALGVGAIGSGRVADSMGTYECLLAASDQPSLTAAALAASLNSYCHVVPDKFVTLAYFPSGIMMKWFHDLLYGEAHGEGPMTRIAKTGIHRTWSPSTTRHWNETHRGPNGSVHYSQSDRYLQS